MNTFFRIHSPLATSSRRRRQAGVTMVEFALVMPFALLLVFGIVQLGLMFTARQVLNTAAFMAARAGSMQHAKVDVMTETMKKQLIPFYQDTSKTIALVRLSEARQRAQADTACPGPCFLKVERLNPSPEAFQDFRITDGGQTFIPNDNLEYRSRTATGPRSGQTIHDANVLKIKVTYGYELKVPLMKSVMGAVMCGIDSGVGAFGKASDQIGPGGNDCTDYYSKGRIPLVTYATVQMQTPAFAN